MASLELVRLSLDDLADQANEHYDAALGYARKAIEHAFRAGEALIAAKAQVPKGEWEAWLEEHFHGTPGTARQYVRLATYRDLVPAHIEGPHEATLYLRGLGNVGGHGGGQRRDYPEELRVRVRMLREKGLSQRAVARITGVDKKRVAAWSGGHNRGYATDGGGFRSQLAKRRESHKQRLRRHRDEGMRARPGPLAATYELVRDAVEAAESAFVQDPDREHKLALAATVKRLQFAEEALAHAAGVSVPREALRA